jgi:hypothetical protein
MIYNPPPASSDYASPFLKAIPNRYAMTGEIQGEVLHIAAEIRGLAGATHYGIAEEVSS